MLQLTKERKEMEEAQRKRNVVVEKRIEDLGVQPETLVETIIRIANTPLFGERRDATAPTPRQPDRRRDASH